MHKGFKCLDISTDRIYISRNVVFDEQVFPFADLHSNAGDRLRSEVELLSPTLVESSMFFGSTTMRKPSVINSSTHSTNESNQNLEETPAGAPVFHAVTQGETGASTEADLPSPESAPGSVPPSTSSPVPPAAGDAQASGAPHVGDTAATRQDVTGACIWASPTEATCTDGTDSSSPDQVLSLSQNLSSAPSGGSSAPTGSGAPPSTAAPPVSQPLRPQTRAQSGVHKPKQYTDGTIRYGCLLLLNLPLSLQV
jgi:hypothetical protein